MKKILLFIALLVPSVVTNAGAELVLNEPDALAQALNKSGLFVKFDPVPLSATPSQSETAYLFRGESCEHKNGQYGSLRVELKKYTAPQKFKGFLFLAANEYKVFADDARFLSSEKLLARAVRVRDEIWPDFVDKSYTQPQLLRSSRGLDEAFLWNSFDYEGKWYRTVFVLLRRIDGKCIAFDANSWKTEAGTELAFNQAKATVYSDVRFQNIRLLDWALPSNRFSWLESNIPASTHVIQFEAQVRGKPKVVAVTLVAQNKPQVEILDWPKTLSRLDGESFLGSGDQVSEQPVWTKQGLVFESVGFSQNFARGGKPRPYNRKLMLRDNTGTISILYSNLDEESNPSILFASTWSDLLIFTDQRKCYALNLKTGHIEPYDNVSQNWFDLDGFSASVGIDLLLGLKTISNPLADNEQNINSLKRPRAFSQYEISKFPFGLRVDGKGENLYAILRKGDTKIGSGNTSIRRLTLERLNKFFDTSNRNELIDGEEVHSISHMTHDIDFYPLGDQIVYKNGSGQWKVANLKTHETVPVKIPDGFDKISRVLAGRALNEITIVGSNQRGSSQIFVARLDGTGLQQLTPAVETIASYHRFPSGKSSYDVSKVVGQHKIDEMRSIWERTQNTVSLSDLLTDNALFPSK